MDGEQPSCQNATERARLEEYADLADVLHGITFDRVSKWGKPIEMKQVKEQYL